MAQLLNMRYKLVWAFTPSHERKQHDYCATQHQSSVNEDRTKSELHCHISQNSMGHQNTCIEFSFLHV